MNVLVWFKRDLRIEDHPALALAAGLGRVLPVHIVEPEYWALAETSGRQWGFVAECLEDLRAALGSRGMPLAVRVGEAVAVLEKLCRVHRIDRIVSHREAGCDWAAARDRRVADWARAAGIDWVEVAQSGGADAALPALAAVPGVEPGVIPAA
ncbi:MAG TPA: deoxyribodipyrimidine photo-lyase, partial [Paracoccaceae bacterium]